MAGGIKTNSERVGADNFSVNFQLSNPTHSDQGGFNGVVPFTGAGSACANITNENINIPGGYAYNHALNPIHAAFSTGVGNNYNTNSGSCTLVGSNGSYTMTVSGMDTSMNKAPTINVHGQALPVDERQYASGVIFLWLPDSWLTSGGQMRTSSITVTASGYSVMSEGNQTNTGEDPGNNGQTYTLIPPGSWSGEWEYSPSWGATHKFTPGEVVDAGMTRLIGYADEHRNIHYDDGGREILCYIIIGANYSFDSIGSYYPWTYLYPNTPATNGFMTFQYTTSPAVGYEGMAGATCNDDDGWTTFTNTSLPADKSQITKVRAVYNRNFSNQIYFNQRIKVKVDQGVLPGTELWFYSNLYTGFEYAPWEGGWNGWYDGSADPCVTMTPNKQHYCANTIHDYAEVIGAKVAISKTVDSDKASFAVGDVVPYTIRFSTQGQSNTQVVIRDTLPSGMSLVPGSAKLNGATLVPTVSGNVLTWTINGVATNTNYDITYSATINSGISHTNTVVADVRTAGGSTQLDTRPESERSATTNVAVFSDGSVLASKLVNKARIDAADDIVFTVNMKNQDATTHAYTDIIDVLPYNGDGRSPATNYHGTVGNSDQLSVDTNQLNHTICYSTADPATISLDPTNASNGTAGDAASCNNGIWTTTKPTTGITAVRSIGGAWSLSDGDINLDITISRNGWRHWDVFTNKAGTVAGDTQLKMITNDVYTRLIAPFVPKIVKDIKYDTTTDSAATDTTGNNVNDKNGSSNKVVRIGDDFYYTIKITNTGDEHNLASQGTIRVTDILPLHLEYGGEITIKNNAGTALDDNTSCEIVGQAITCLSDYVLPTNEADAINIHIKVSTAMVMDNITNTAKVEGGVCLGDISAIAGNDCEQDISNKCPIGNDLPECKESETTDFRTPELHIEKSAYSLINNNGIDIGDYGYFVITVTNEGNIETRGTVTIKDPVPEQFRVFDTSWAPTINLPWEWDNRCELDNHISNTVTCNLDTQINDIVYGAGPSSGTTGHVNSWQIKIPVLFDPENDPETPVDIANMAYVGGGNDQICENVDEVTDALIGGGADSDIFARCGDDHLNNTRPRLGIAKAAKINNVAVDEVRYDDVFQYQITVKNIGEVPTDERSSIEDWMPDEMELVLGNNGKPIITEEGSGRPDTQYCKIDEDDPYHLICQDIVPRGFYAADEVVVNITVKPKIIDGFIENTGYTWGDDHDCPNITSAQTVMRCHDTAVIRVVAPNIIIKKTAWDVATNEEARDVPFGKMLKYTITVTNDGTTSTNKPIAIFDVMSDNVEPVTDMSFVYNGTADGINGNWCSVEDNTMTCADVVPVGFDVGDTLTITYYVRPLLPEGIIKNIAYVLGEDPDCLTEDSVMYENNESCRDDAEVNIISPMLKVEKMASIDRFLEGSVTEFIYNIRVTNVGDYKTTDVTTMSDTVPDTLGIKKLRVDGEDQEVLPVASDSAELSEEEPIEPEFESICTINSVTNAITCHIDEGLEPGESVNVAVTVQTKENVVQPIKNVASVYGGGDTVCVENAEDRITTGDSTYNDVSRCSSLAMVSPEKPVLPPDAGYLTVKIGIAAGLLAFAVFLMKPELCGKIPLRAVRKIENSFYINFRNKNRHE